MGLPISIVILAPIAAATLYMAVVQIFRLNRNEDFSLEELDRRSEQLCRELERLPKLQGKERHAACRTIAKAMRWESLFLLRIVNDWFYHSPSPKAKAEHAELAIATFREAWELHSMVSRILFLMRFAPPLLKDCHRLREAALQFGRMWIAFSRLCQSQYPDQLGDLELPKL